MNKKWLIISLAVALLSGGGYGGWKYFGAEEKAAEETMNEAPSFPTVAADVGEVKKTIYATGEIEAKDREEIKAELSGKVERLLVEDGQRVSKGDVLFTMDTSDAALELQKLDLTIMRTKKELDELKKRKPTILSDKAGKVKEVLVKEGDQVSEETVVATIVNTEFLKITGRFSTFEAEHFTVGQKVKVFLPSSLSYLEGTVSEVDLIGKVKQEDTKGTSETSTEENKRTTSVRINAPQNVEVLVKKQGALYVGEKGVIQYIDPQGVLYSSATPTPFELPDEIEIRANTTGKVNKVAVDVDDTVKAGQLLMEMDTSMNDLELREKELALQESMLSLEQKRRDIAKKQVTAPISGEVTKLDIKEGETIDPGKVAMILMDTSSFSFVAAVDELDIPDIKPGQTADVYVTAFGDQAFTGKVVEIPNEGTKTDKKVSFEVEIAVENNGKLTHGMTGDCDIHIQKIENVTRLPVSAVEIMEAGKGTVMVKDPKNGEPVPKEVEVGVEGAEFVEIRKGLTPGEEVLMMNGV
ncbi:HlyD family efflux transporter periplasmic adaptor subunit [Brevibacillus migulae]|uniref:HlyD family efflux transporter periplasmic adaptor subunit n=1 Tax=Brevibacillus migulae TaxID=1644114 RepID=UPI00106E7036|nr:HlyD family efflux transporter periplasmic adaptor subunit [Brevibacillus migulae]